ncbi:MAG: cytochrome c biogenesis protein DipZ [Rhodospirillales bacterium]|nr:cytochrome c biogenesis protein DipZ [Alphaproteobacteria bacterium]MCB9986640.1 cytochrome c biogenesis protein DipZ [Rhodospirillales bacterium]USO08596.1 MAG: cytochrome c biogenesis protein DipZ [Rhodospirillales bacterium]
MIDPTTLGLSFFEGMALILSPCILPILPLMLGASIDGGRARPVGIVTGFVLAFTVFAVVSRRLLAASGIDSEILRDASLILLMLFGLVMLFPRLSDRWGTALGSIAGRGDALIARIRGRGFWGGLGIGLLVGVVWTPCGGPILGAAIVGIVQATSELAASASIAAFSLGAALPMLAIALSGRALLDRMGFLKRHAYAIRRTVGVVMIAAAVTIYSGFDLKLVAWQARAQETESAPPAFAHGLENPYPAPEIAGITDWINSSPLTLAQLRGKVVLIDFWTYSCINCIRTLPHVTAWYDKYKNDGLVVIGVHAPEFPFERKLKNVEAAVKQYGIHYPVALDNDFATWRAYSNRFWPAHYLIDRQGRVVYTHFGEGNYDTTENNMRALLGIDGRAHDKPVAITAPGQTPETYLGFARAENFVGTFVYDKPALYDFPAALEKNHWALSGSWTVGAQKIIAGPDAALRLNFTAGKVFVVLGSADKKPVGLALSLDGKPLPPVRVDGEKLYTLYNGGTFGADHGVLEIRPARAGLEAYAFTFGQ